MTLLPKTYYTLEETKQYLTEITDNEVNTKDIVDLIENRKLNLYVDYRGIIHGCRSAGTRDKNGVDLPENSYYCELSDYEIYSNAIFKSLVPPIITNDGELSLRLGEISHPFHLHTCPDLDHKEFIENISGVGSRLYNMNDKQNKEFYPNIHCKIIFIREELLAIFDPNTEREQLVKIKHELYKSKKQIDVVNNKVLEIESENDTLKTQLDDQQHTPQRTRSQTDETNTDKKLIAMLAILLAKQSNTFRIGDRPNATQISEEVLNLTMQIVSKLGMNENDIIGLKANTDKISKAVQAHADMFKLSKD